MAVEELQGQLKPIVDWIAGKPLDAGLAAGLNSTFAPGGAVYDSLAATLKDGVADGWLANREQGGIKFGRAIKPSDALQGFSVDVVEMTDVKGPHHIHPNGEIDLVVPLDESAAFDGQGAGWVVYEAGSAHFPTVTGGKAIVLYLLPDGAIEFTGKKS